jgi:hypothetical protein
MTRDEINEHLRLGHDVVPVFRAAEPPAPPPKTPVAALNADYRFSMRPSDVAAKCRQEGVGALLFTPRGHFLAVVDERGQPQDDPPNLARGRAAASPEARQAVRDRLVAYRATTWPIAYAELSSGVTADARAKDQESSAIFAERVGLLAEEYAHGMLAAEREVADGG